MKRLAFVFIFLSLLSPLIDAQETADKTLAITILNEKSASLKDLPPSAIKIYENKQPLTVTAFKPDETPVSIGFLFDASESFADGETRAADVVREKFFDLVNAADRSNEYFLMSFARESKTVTDWTSDKNKIFEGLNKLPAATEKCGAQCSPIYDAYFAAIEKLSTARHARRILIVATDGQNLDSAHTGKELRRLAREKDVIIYTLLALAPDTLLTDRHLLPEISEMTGGTFFAFSNPKRLAMLPDRERLEKSCRQIFSFLAQTLQSRYEIKYQPAPAAAANNQKSSKIKVEINLPPDLRKQFGKLQIFHRLEN